MPNYVLQMDPNERQIYVLPHSLSAADAGKAASTSDRAVGPAPAWCCARVETSSRPEPKLGRYRAVMCTFVYSRGQHTGAAKKSGRHSIANTKRNASGNNHVVCVRPVQSAVRGRFHTYASRRLDSTEFIAGAAVVHGCEEPKNKDVDAHYTHTYTSPALAKALHELQARTVCRGGIPTMPRPHHQLLTH